MRRARSIVMFVSLFGLLAADAGAMFDDPISVLGTGRRGGRRAARRTVRRHEVLMFSTTVELSPGDQVDGIVPAPGP